MTLDIVWKLLVVGALSPVALYCPIAFVILSLMIIGGVAVKEITFPLNAEEGTLLISSQYSGGTVSCTPFQPVCPELIFKVFSFWISFRNLLYYLE